MTATEARTGDRFLLRRYRERGDLQAREQLVRRMSSLVDSVARSYRPAGDPEELRQAARLGLAKAIERFDPGFGVPFRAYAAPTMSGEILRHLRDTSWAVRPPRGLQERSLLVARTVDDLSGRLGRSPTTAEVAAALRISTDEVVEALQAGRGRRAVSLEAPRGSGDDDGGTLADLIGEEDGRLGGVERRADLQRVRGVLTDAERTVLRMRFAGDLTQREIAERTGMSPSEVSRTLREALARLQQALGTPAG
jgi:RNA polymerase sigma-B factor